MASERSLDLLITSSNIHMLLLCKKCYNSEQLAVPLVDCFAAATSRLWPLKISCPQDCF